MNKTKVIYILGAGRSGSTLLNNVLGQHPDIFPCGELVHFAHPFMNDVLCACGVMFNECEEWSKIREKFTRGSGFTIEQYLALQQRFELYQTPYDKGIPQPRRFFTELSRLAFPLNTKDDAFQDYAKCVHALYSQIAECTGRSVVLDASKNAYRAYALSMAPEIELHIIRLVRDGRGVASSAMKHIQNEKRNFGWDTLPAKVWRSAIAWTKSNLVCDILLRKQLKERSYFLRYEDFAQDPSAIIKSIGDWMDMDLSYVTNMLDKGKELSFGHTMCGNNARMQKVSKVQIDDAWKKKLSPKDLQQFNLICGWLNKRYGYP